MAIRKSGSARINPTVDSLRRDPRTKQVSKVVSSADFAAGRAAAGNRLGVGRLENSNSVGLTLLHSFLQNSHRDAKPSKSHLLKTEGLSRTREVLHLLRLGARLRCRGLDRNVASGRYIEALVRTSVSINVSEGSPSEDLANRRRFRIRLTVDWNQS